MLSSCRAAHRRGRDRSALCLHPAWCCIGRTHLNSPACTDSSGFHTWLLIKQIFSHLDTRRINRNGDFKCVLSLIFIYFFFLFIFFLLFNKCLILLRGKNAHTSKTRSTMTPGDTSRRAIQALQALLYTPPVSSQPHFKEEKQLHSGQRTEAKY